MNCALRALVAHDEPSQIEFATKGLVRAGLETIALHDGRDTYAYLFQNKKNMPDLVILRVELPLFTGLEILNQMRKEPHTQNTPVILLADSAEEQRALEALDLPLCSCFVRPLTFAKIVYALPRLNLRINESLLYQATPSSL